MLRSDGDPSGDATRNTKGFAVDRRSYLKLAGAAAGSAALLSGPASASFTRRGIEFNQVTDMVADAGCDPTGTEPCDAQIEDAAEDYTLLKFPPGEYKITEKNVVLDATNLGFLGEGDVRFVVPENFNEKVLVVDRGTGLLFEGIDIDQTADGATPALHLGVEDDLRVHDVELIGQGIHPDSVPRGQPGYSPGPGPENGNPAVHDFFYPIVRSPDGTGLVTDLTANNHGLMGSYNAGSGRSGIWVGVATYGTITLRNCHIEEFGSNGTYTSRTYGVVQFEGGVYRNNDNNQIRLGSEGSYIDGAVLDVDADASEAPNPSEALNYRGVRIEMGHNYRPVDVTIENCDISIRSAPHSGGGVVAEATAGEFTVKNTRIGIEVDGVRGVLGKEPDGGVYPPPNGPHSGTFSNVNITGSAANTEAIELDNRPDSVVKNCCIHQSGTDRDGVVVANSDGCRIKNSTIDVTGDQVVDENCSALTYGISDDGSCPAPRYGAGDDLPRKLSFVSDGEEFSYTFSVSGDLGKSTVRNASIDPDDTISGHTATGFGNGGVDSYGFSGEVLGFDFEGDAAVYLDDEAVDPDEFPDNTMTFASDGGAFSYAFWVSGDLEKSDAMGASIDPDDDITGHIATGSGNGGLDSYSFSGEVVGLDLAGDATVSLNGDEVDPDRYFDLRTFTIDGVDTRTDYSFSVSDDLTGDGGLTGEDEITGTTATGAVGGGSDSYRFVGDITEFSMSSDADLRLDGSEIDVTEFLPRTLTVEGTGPYTGYSFSVSGGIAGRFGHTREDVVDIQRGHVDGAVGGGRDSYAFSDDLVAFTLDSDVRIVVDRSERTITVVGKGQYAAYQLSVTGGFQPTDSLTGEDEISGGTASGAIRGGHDVYGYTGEVRELMVLGGPSVTITE